MTDQNPFEPPSHPQTPPPAYVPPPPRYEPVQYLTPQDPSSPYSTYVATVAPKRSRGPLFVIALFVVLVVAGIVFFAVRSRPLKVERQVESQEQRQADVLAAFGDDGGAAIDASDPAQIAALRATFDKLSTAARSRDGRGMSEAFDIDRLCAEIAATGMPGTQHFGDEKLRKSVGPAIGAGMARNADNFVWEGYQFRQIKPLARKDEALVYMRIDVGDGYTAKFRWWVRRSDGQWRIYDYEDLSIGVRTTSLIGAMMGPALGNNVNSQAANGVQAVLQAVMASVQHINNEDPAAALKVLRSVETEAVFAPPLLEALRQTLMGSSLLQLGEPEEAMTALKKSQSLHEDQPLAVLLTASAHNALGEPEQALAAVRQYEQAVGPEALSYYCAGEAHVLKGNVAEALALFRKGLDDTPTSEECFLGLFQNLGDDGTAELRQRLKGFRDVSDPLRTVGYTAISETDDVTLERVIQLFPNETNVIRTYFQAELHLIRGEHAKSIAIFEASAQRFAAEPELADVYLEEYRYALLKGGRALESYRMATDKPAAFVESADELVETEDADQLDKLLKAHVVQKHGEQPIADHYAGELAELRKQPADAERFYRKALAAQTDDDWKGAHRRSLLHLLHSQDRHEDAYRTVPPKWETFEELCSLVAFEKPAVMHKLVQLARADFKDKPKVDWQEARAHWLAKDYTRCAELLKRHRGNLVRDEDMLWTTHFWLVASAIRTNRPADAMEHLVWARQNETPLDDEVQLLVYAANGNVAETTSRLERVLKEQETTLAEYLDLEEDLATALQSPAFKPWRDAQLKAGPPAPAATAPSTRPAASTN